VPPVGESNVTPSMMKLELLLGEFMMATSTLETGRL
jgi:hypothetical protein